MKKTTKLIELSVTDDQAFEQFEEARAELEHFMGQNQKVFEQLSLLADTYNTAMELAEKAIRAKAVEYGVGVSCGPFRFKTFRETINTDKLYELVGEESFKQLGGRIETVQQYLVDKDVFHARAAGNELAQTAVSITPVFTTPKKINLS